MPERNFIGASRELKALQFQRVEVTHLHNRFVEELRAEQSMSLTRRTFLKNSTYAGASLVVADAIKPAALVG